MGLARCIQSHEKQGPTGKTALPKEAIIQNRRADKQFPRQENTKEFIIIKPLLYEMLKRFIKKKIKTVNNKMAIKTYVSTIESKKLTKQTRTETESWIWKVS